MVYSIGANEVVQAIDAKTGQKIWSYQPKSDPIVKKVLFAPYSRGVAVGRGKVFVGRVDARGSVSPRQSLGIGRCSPQT